MDAYLPSRKHAVCNAVPPSRRLRDRDDDVEARALSFGQTLCTEQFARLLFQRVEPLATAISVVREEIQIREGASQYFTRGAIERGGNVSQIMPLKGGDGRINLAGLVAVEQRQDFGNLTDVTHDVTSIFFAMALERLGRPICANLRSTAGRH